MPHDANAWHADKRWPCLATQHWFAVQNDLRGTMSQFRALLCGLVSTYGHVSVRASWECRTVLPMAHAAGLFVEISAQAGRWY